MPQKVTHHQIRAARSLVGEGRNKTAADISPATLSRIESKGLEGARHGTANKLISHFEKHHGIQFTNGGVKRSSNQDDADTGDGEAPPPRRFSGQKATGTWPQSNAQRLTPISNPAPLINDDEEA